MRTTFSLLLLALFTTTAWAQPANDDCDSAEQLTLSNAPSCPSTATVTDNFSYSNVDATPITPFPLFICADGTNSGPAAEVWFTFTATANLTTITVSGLTTPSMVLFRGNSCISLQGINCNSGNGSTTITTNTLVGDTYYLLVSGGDPDDQGTFDLEFVSGNLCGACVPSGAIELSINPPPINGTFTSGSTVTVCATINEWDSNAAGTIEWLHAVTFDFGPGWDQVTAGDAIPPASLYGSGTWAWYDSWTGCNSGNSFGPGFAFESNVGLGCGGTGVDGDPGNNWGDGNVNTGNGDITPSNPITFCVNVTVSDCPPITTGEDLGIDINIYSDGDSGNWNQTGCNTGQSIDITSSAICCDDLEPLVAATDLSCFGADDGSFDIQGNGGLDPTEVFNFYVLDGGNPVYECLGCSGLVTTGPILPPGSYSVVAINVATDCPVSTTEVIVEPAQPTVTATQTNMPCPGDAATLNATTNPAGSVVTYTWTGPGGPYSGQSPNVFQAGTYTVIATVDGCESSSDDVDVTFVDFTTSIDVPNTAVCNGSDLTFTANGGDSFSWENVTTGTSLGSGPSITVTFTQPATIRLTATDANGCTAIDEVAITINQLPTINISQTGSGCENESVQLFADGAGGGGSYLWSDGTSNNPLTITGLTPGVYPYSVTGTDANGCENTASYELEILPVPSGTLDATPNPVCSGEPTTVTVNVPQISSIFWYNGVAPANQNPATLNLTSSQTITADVMNTFGCINTFFVPIDVEQPPSPTNVICGLTTPNSIEFVWDPVPGADNYEVTIDSDPPILIGPTTYTATGLNPGQSVTIVVQPLGANLCPVPSSTVTCMTDACPPITLTITQVPDICLQNVNAPFNLTYTSSNNSGTFSWSGPGIIDQNLGTFDPDVAGPGMHQITLSYTEAPCTYTEMTTINVYETPEASFTIVPNPECIGETVDVTFNGMAGATATYAWDFDNGNASPGNGQGPHLVSWDTPGTKTVTLTVTENGCSSTEFSTTVDILGPLNAPVITCSNQTTSSVTFTWPVDPDATSYDIDVTTGQTGVSGNGTITFDGLMPNETVTIDVTANTNNPCGSVTASASCSTLDCPDFTINISSVPDVCLTGSTPAITLTATASGGNGSGTISWSGPQVSGDQFDVEMAGPGMHDITATYTEGNCSESAILTVNVFDPPTANFTVSPNLVCIGEDATVTYTGTASAAADFTWTFNGGTATTGTGIGPHTVNWATSGTKTISLTVIENGCTSTSFTQEVTVNAPLAAPVINCAPTPSSIVFSWNAVTGATDYMVNILSGPTGAMGVLDINALTYTVTGLVANDAVEIEVIAVGSAPCGNSMATQTCVAEDCPMVTILIDPVDPVCLDGTAGDIDLEATVSGGNGGGTFTWSGANITDPVNGIFDPVGAGAGTWTVTGTYQEGNCPYNASIDIQVNAQPTADFTLDPVICQTETATATYTGSAGAGATYNWNFGDGVASPGTGQGPHTISWPNSGVQTITLTVIENDCSSTEFSQEVDVQAPLAAPAIMCEPTTSSIIFSWDPVTGATGYTVNVLVGPNGVYDDMALTYTVDGLIAGDEVEIEVTAIGTGACGNSSASLSCIADPCPAVTIDITAVDPICLDAAAMSIDLEAMVSGGPGMGTLSWSGTGMTNSATGTFDPAVAGPGTWTITATYVEENCSYDNTMAIVVNAQPTADFTVDATICQTDTATVIYTGSADASATYNWDFAGGNADPGTGQGPHTVNWPSSGMPTISLTVIANDCASEAFTETITVDPTLAVPVITCQPTTSSIVFSWEPVSGASDYTVNLISGTAGVYDDTNLTYTVTGLDAGDQVEIEVIANSSNSCPSSSATQICEALDCPTVAFSIDAVDPICLNANSQSIDLSATATGGQGGGALNWAGTGITAPLAGTFDPTVSGVGVFDITATYTEDNCVYTAMLQIEVNAEPTADFSLSSDLICVGDTITLTYTGTASAAATYDWDFDGGQADPAAGQGPFLVSWSSSGTPTISLTVTENGCTSPAVTNDLTVSAPLAAAVISCSPDYTSIVFSWSPVVGADSYSIDDLVLPAGAIIAYDNVALTYTVSNLTPGDAVTIQVNALSSGPCGNSSVELSCSATPCDNITFAPISYGPFCANDDIQTLTGMVNGSMGTGTFTWSGPGVVDETGAFDPALSGVGSFDLTLSYEENSCLFDTAYTIEVLAVPSADFTVDPLICVEDEATLTYTGMASANAIYNWDIGLANIVGDDPGPYTLSWMDPGTYTISLFVEDNGCTSPELMQTIVVDALIPPVVITCQETSATTVTFAWEDVPGADTYTVNVLQGPMGTQVGNTYLMTGLTPDDVVEIEVVASGNSVCGPSTAIGSCVAEACQPLTLSLDGPTNLCAGEDAQITFNINTNQEGPFAITYTVNGAESTVTLADGESISLNGLTENIDIAIVEIIDTALPECVYLSDAIWGIQVDQPVSAGTATNPDALCEDTPNTFDLNSLLTGADANGIWTETSVNPSTPGAFNAVTGTFNTSGQAPGTYSFLYTLEGGACPDASNSIEVVVVPTPVADAGPEQFLSCNMGATTLGGNSSSGSGITYLWTVSNPEVMITDPTQAMIDVSTPGTYTLTVSNEFGCTSSDQVTVTADFEVPVADVSISEISCFAANDGAIVINNVSGGIPPYTFVLNDGEPTTNTFFNNLGAAEYSLLIQDANGCFTELFVNLTEPEEVIVELITSLENNGNTISLGESVTLEAVFNPNLNIESIRWKPDSIATLNATSVEVSPLETTSYTVTIADENGCSDSDNLTLIVEKLRPVFVPTAFSPDDDGTNDIFYVQGGSDIQEIKSFNVFNRWGESVFANTNFQPNDPTQGWDGRHRGQPLNAAVFVYFLEVEFTDGEVILYKGDVLLMK